MFPKGKILIIDAEELFLRTTSAMLEREGYSCARATNAAKAKELATQEMYDVVIADLHLSGNQQLELVTHLQKTKAPLAVILVSGSPSLDSALRAISLQVAEYFVKPFEAQHLVRTVQRLVERTKIQRTALDLQQRWQIWSRDLHDFAAAMPFDAPITERSLEAMLSFSLQNLSRCIGDLQDLRSAMTNGADCRADALVTEELSVSPKTAGRAAPALPFNVPAETRLHAKGIPAELLAGIEQLSRREREVLRLLLNNQRPRTIAQTLFISLYTVRNHLRSIFEKFAVHSQAELLTMLGQYTSYVDLQDAV